MTEQNFEQMRRAMVASQLRTTGVNDARVVGAMGMVPRERFVPAEQRLLAYTDRSLPLGNGRAMPTPMVLGRLLTEARVNSTDRVLLVGAGTGYAAAVLAELAAEVIALEEDQSLVAVAPSPAPAKVTRVAGPLKEGWAAGAPYDVILFDGAVEHVPDAIVAQLKEGGRLATGLVEEGVTRLAVGSKAGSSYGLLTFADAEVPMLPGFARPSGFRF